MGSVYHVLTNKFILRFAYLFVEKIVDTIYTYIVIERLLHNTFLLHVVTKLRYSILNIGIFAHFSIHLTEIMLI